MNRRDFVAGFASTVSLAAVSGCLDVLGPDGLRLGGIVLANRRDAPVDARLQVAQDGETVLDETYELAATDEGSDSGVFLNDAWPDSVAVHEVTVEPASGESESFAYTAEASDGDCTIATVQITADGITFGSHRATGDTPCAPSSTAG